jgi:hypothetical protein
MLNARAIHIKSTMAASETRMEPNIFKIIEEV